MFLIFFVFFIEKWDIEVVGFLVVVEVVVVVVVVEEDVMLLSMLVVVLLVEDESVDEKILVLVGLVMVCCLKLLIVFGNEIKEFSFFSFMIIFGFVNIKFFSDGVSFDMFIFILRC